MSVLKFVCTADIFLLRVAANTGTSTWLEIPRRYKKAEKDDHNPRTPVHRTVRKGLGGEVH